MLYNIEFLPKATAEFSEATEWYERSKPNLGEVFSESVKQRLSLIQQYPERYRKVKGNFRQTYVKGFPYCIVYYLVTREQKIIIFSIFHHSRHPASKFRR